jgi:hypothetical protein
VAPEGAATCDQTLGLWGPEARWGHAASEAVKWGAEALTVEGGNLVSEAGWECAEEGWEAEDSVEEAS